MCKMTRVASQKRKGQMQMWTKHEQTANKQCYLEVLTRLRESVRRKRPELWPPKWILHYDNAPAHDALRVREFLANKSITKMDHPPYAPDLAPLQFLALSRIKTCPEGTTIC
jgi:transposase